MFKIMGADGKEYGFVSIDQIIRWIGEGRANHDTMALREGEPGWKPLIQYPEFVGALGVKPPVVTAAPPVVAVPVSGVPISPAPISRASVSVAPVSAAPAAEPRAAARALALQKVSGPAIGLMITGGLGIATNALSLIVHLARTVPPPPPPGFPPEIAHVFEVMNGPMGIAAAIFGLAISVFVLYGALKMQKLSNRVLAFVAAIVAMVPCFSPCCLVGIPVGIWALIVLSRPEVRSQFDR